MTMRESKPRVRSSPILPIRRAHHPRPLSPDAVSWLGADGRTWTRPVLAKEDAECCVSRRDDLGRFPLGYCSPGCERRPRPA